MRSRSVIYRILSTAAFILLEIAAMCLVLHNGEVQNRWFAKTGQAVRGYVWGTTERWSDYFSLAAMNDSLAKRNVELAEKLAQYNEMSDSCRMRYGQHGYSGHTAAAVSAAGSKTSSGVAGYGAGSAASYVAGSGAAGSSHKRYTFIPAKVLKISNNTQHNYLIVNKGTEDGVEVGDGIITTKGIGGIVEAVSDHYSYAISLKNHNVHVSARLGNDGPVGSLRWDGKTGNNAVLSEIPHHINLNEADTVYTSGFSFIFPENIPLGTTAEATVRDGSTYDIKVKLFEDFSRLRYVAIVKDHDKKEISGLEDAAK